MEAKLNEENHVLEEHQGKGKSELNSETSKNKETIKEFKMATNLLSSS